jgi:hypothetical protein
MGKIKGRVFLDENGNGLKNATEEGIGGITIIMETGERLKTDDDGSFLFEGVRAGEHLVAVDERKLPHDHFIISDASAIVSVFGGGTSRVSFAVGRILPPEEEKTEDETIPREEMIEETKKKEDKKELSLGKISGRVFIDHDKNGHYDVGEEVVCGITVLLDGRKRVKTDKHGKYMFYDVSPGRHTISVVKDTDFKTHYCMEEEQPVTISVKGNVNHKVDIPLLIAGGIRIDIHLTTK